MTVQSSKFRLSKTEEKMLREKLAKTLMTIIAIVGFTLIVLIFFAPKLGAFFGFFSIHRNDTDPNSIIKPSTPIFSNVPKATKSDKLTLNGFAQAGVTINLFVNGPQADKTTVGADGLFTFNNIQLISGSNTIFAKAVDQQNIESDTSTTYIVVLDTEKPKLTLDTLKDGATIKNLDKRIDITGKVSEKASITINDKLAIVRPDLSFEALLGVEEGNVNIKITVTDEAGNVTEQKLTVKYVKGT